MYDAADLADRIPDCSLVGHSHPEDIVHSSAVHIVDSRRSHTPVASNIGSDCTAAGRTDCFGHTVARAGKIERWAEMN